ncbi:GNAT family N-acetyltransferase [Streptomyces reniochalinae]|uniref:GNAT family N-acetyltransferase n=1 Tax=Streptomyces reniochalinae TaxID=2250578 RepID=A0A367EG82_9ACTN|nr:GNAT family N-acetyltransferase [Streptomyces reniochalinae]RCG16655.1 GNAT family N-acetyltransferase [Streptomyces reniochalinae]
MLLRPVRDTEEDAETVRKLAEAAFGASHALKGEAPEESVPDDRAAARAARGREKIRHLARHDPAGNWIAEDESGQAVGAAQSSVREGTWGLGLLVVAPGAQGKGVGRALLQRTLEYGRGCLRGIICCSRHPAAARVYRQAGFELHPTIRMRGVVDRDRLGPVDGPAVEGTPRDQDLLDSVDRRLRGGAHGPDHAYLMRHHRLVVADDLAGSGYCYINAEGKVALLAATSRRLASRVLRAALLGGEEGRVVEVHDVTAEQQWAVDVGLAAGLELRSEGFVCFRGMRPPTPYIPSGAFL